jgi:hypothetical protein
MTIKDAKNVKEAYQAEQEMKVLLDKLEARLCAFVKGKIATGESVSFGRFLFELGMECHEDGVLKEHFLSLRLRMNVENFA